ncbi:SCML2-like protein [Mya arenaria]|uniref:SCML2-like protein n=1 Tax=Mya arenaria TaxID=6604 RepID=A0ABY7EHK6_MYAAR|nr:SCML2-like protein [Mya arenaria]
MTSPKGFSEVQSETFNWEEYLKESGGEPAPETCFKQASTPPENTFEPSQKIEAADPRNLTSTCVATVIGAVGPRLRLRLDGSDNSNDFWRLTDSGDIHPIGFSEKNGGLLQPPLGFRMNPSSWPSFMQKTLNGAVCAPSSCFKQEPLGPRRNEFKPSMKLEAVDRKNPMLICPATIGAINGDQVHVRFDGWKGAFDYWCKYDDRDIFPCGWCAKNGHPLQPPGQKGSGAVTKPGRGRLSDSSTQGLNPTSRNSTPSRQKSPSPAPTPTMCVYINHGCNCGPYLNQQRILQLPSQYGPGVINRVLYDILKGCMECAFTEKVVYNLIPEGHGRVVISASHGHKTYTKRVIGVETGDEFWGLLDRLFEDLGCCQNLFSTKPLNNILRASSQQITDPISPTNPTQNAAGQQNQQRVYATRLIQNLSRCDAHTRLRRVRRLWILVHTGRQTQLIGQLMRLSDTFEIDGKALLLLNSDMMMKYMGLKLGPVLKLCNLIDRLRQRAR